MWPSPSRSPSLLLLYPQTPFLLSNPKFEPNTVRARSNLLEVSAEGSSDNQGYKQSVDSVVPSGLVEGKVFFSIAWVPFAAPGTMMLATSGAWEVFAELPVKDQLECSLATSRAWEVFPDLPVKDRLECSLVWTAILRIEQQRTPVYNLSHVFSPEGPFS